MWKRDMAEKQAEVHNLQIRVKELSEENQKLKDDLAKIKNNLPEEYRKLKFKLNYQ
jgi:predicted  nucleic acid-binding Zn-ribbon protein